MAENNKLTQVADDLVVTMNYSLTVDGEIVDSSEEDGPIEFLQGYGNIIPGLEAHLGGLAIGESLQVSVAAKDAYGEFDPEQVVDVPLDEFPEEICVEPGVELEMKDQDGDMLAQAEDHGLIRFQPAEPRSVQPVEHLGPDLQVVQQLRSLAQQGLQVLLAKVQERRILDDLDSGVTWF